MKKYSGFTILELVITMALIAVMMTIGLPSIKSFRQDNQLVAATNELISAFHIARSEAIKQNSRVSICASSDGASCSDAAEWKDGWIVFVDANGDFDGTGATCIASGTDCLLRVHEEFTAADMSLIGEDADSTSITKLTFTSRGLPKDTNGISQSGVFNICSLDDDGDTRNSRAMVISLSGRVRVSDNAAVITQCP